MLFGHIGAASFRELLFSGNCKALPTVQSRPMNPPSSGRLEYSTRCGAPAHFHVHSWDHKLIAEAERWFMEIVIPFSHPHVPTKLEDTYEAPLHSFTPGRSSVFVTVVVQPLVREAIKSGARVRSSVRFD